MRISKISGTIWAISAMISAVPAFAATFPAVGPSGTAMPAVAVIGQEVTFSFPVTYSKKDTSPCGVKVQFGDSSPPNWHLDAVQQSAYPIAYMAKHVYTKTSAGQPYGGVFLPTVIPDAHSGLPACSGAGNMTQVTVNAPVALTADLGKALAPSAVSPSVNPTAALVVVVTPSVANVAGTYGMSAKLKGQVKSSAGGSMAGYKMAFEVDGKTVGSTVSDADGAGSVDLAVTEVLAVGAHPLKLVAQAPDGKSYRGEANLDIVKTETKLSFQIAYPGNSKVVEQETAITFKGQLKRITDSGDTGPEGRNIALLLDGKSIGTAITDATGHYNHVYTIPKTMEPTQHALEVAFEGDAHYLATVAPNKETFTVKNKPKLPPNVINGSALKGSGIY